MRSLMLSCLFAFVIAPVSFIHAQINAADTASGSASKEEVEQLRKEVAAQRQTIEELKAMVQQLVDTKAQAANSDSRHSDSGQMVNAALVTADAQAAKSDQKPAEKQATAPLTAGWNGEHFFIKAGEFQLQPY